MISFVLSLALFLIGLSILVLFTLAFSRDAQQGLQFRLESHSKETGSSPLGGSQGTEGCCAQEEQYVHLFSKLMSSQLQPELHIGAAVIWVSSGKCLKISQ